MFYFELILIVDYERLSLKYILKVYDIFEFTSKIRIIIALH
jgi:hypothetical protein